MALTSDFLKGNILDRMRELARRLEELERAQAAVNAALGIEPAGRGGSAGGKGDGAPRGVAATRVFLRDADTGTWWQLGGMDDNGVEFLALQRVREAEVR